MRAPYAIVVLPVVLFALVIASLDSYARRNLSIVSTASSIMAGGGLAWSAVRQYRAGRLPALRALLTVLLAGPIVFALVWLLTWMAIGGLVYFTAYEKEQTEVTVERVFRTRGRTCVAFRYDRVDREITSCGKVYAAPPPRERERIVVHSKVGPLGVTVLRIEPDR